MSKLVKGYTPVPDAVRDDLDVLAAVVFGRVWRYCQQNGVCFASVERLAEECGLSATTTRERLRSLEEHGWLRRETRKGKTTVYRDAGRWTVEVVGREVTPTADVGGATADVGVPQREALPKKQVKKQTKSTTADADASARRNGKARVSQDQIRAMVDTLGEARGYPIANYARHVRDAKALVKAGRTPDDVQTIVGHLLRERRDFFVVQKNPLTMTTVSKYASVVLDREGDLDLGF